MQSTSKGLSHGIQKGMGFRDRHGAGNSTDLHVPGMHTEALPKLIHGRMWNSVLSRVGQIGMSKGRPIGPTLSGGIGRSGMHGRKPPSPANADNGISIIVKDRTIRAATLTAFMAIPQKKALKRPMKRYSMQNLPVMLSLGNFPCQLMNFLNRGPGQRFACGPANRRGSMNAHLWQTFSVPPRSLFLPSTWSQLFRIIETVLPQGCMSSSQTCDRDPRAGAGHVIQCSVMAELYRCRMPPVLPANSNL